MISYQPVRKKTKQLTVYYLLVGIMLIGGVAILLARKTVYARHMAAITPSESLILPAYQEKVAHETDVAHLATVGDKLLKKDMPLYAGLNFKRASDLDSNFRDVAYGWAYAVLKAHPDNLTPDNLNEIKTALDRVDTVDPHYLPALKLKKTIAEIEKDEQSVQLISRRIELLQK